jgi:hypothetical protein
MKFRVIGTIVVVLVLITVVVFVNNQNTDTVSQKTSHDSGGNNSDFSLPH